MINYDLLHTQEILKNLVHAVEKIYPAMIFDAGEYSRVRHSVEVDKFDDCLERAIEHLRRRNIYIEPTL